MDFEYIYDEIELQECPNCGGAALLDEENGWCYYVSCVDCGAHTVEAEFKNDAERLEAAKGVAYLWNIGKVLTDGIGD